MKIGVEACHYYFKGTKTVDTAWLRRHGYDCVDYGRICHTDDELYSLPEDEFIAFLKKEGEELRNGGIEVYQVHGPWPTDDKTPESCAEKWEFCKKAIKGTAALGSKYLVMHPHMPFGWGGEQDHDAAEAANEDFFKKLCAYAEPYGVTICLENMPFKAQRISTVDKIVEFVTRLNLPNLAICLDTGHANVYGHDLGECVRMCGKHLKTLHVHDNDTRCDAHTIPFDGKCNWEGFKTALKEIGYDGCMSLECFINPNYPPHLDEYMRVGIAKTAAYLADKEI